MATAGTSNSADSALALADELALARRRGLSELNSTVGSQTPVVLPVLEGLARSYDLDGTGGRVRLIEHLLREALEVYEDVDAVVAEFIHGLFFDAEGRAPGPARATGLLDATRKATGLSDDNLSKRRRAYFVQFAEFLLDFVSERLAAQPETDDEPPVPPVTDEPARRPGRALILGLVVGLVVIIVAVVVVVRVLRQPGGTADGSKATSSSPSASPSPTFTGPALKFDALGSSASNIINVYPGPLATDRDREKNGTFTSGDVVKALCVTTGRSVSSDPSAGETSRTSDQWVQIEAVPGKVQFATLVYGEIQPAASDLPACTGVS